MPSLVEYSRTVMVRLERAIAQPIQILDKWNETPSNTKFEIAGLTQTYFVTMRSFSPQCTCVDFVLRGERLPCKHIFYVYLRVLKLPSPRILNDGQGQPRYIEFDFEEAFELSRKLVRREEAAASEVQIKLYRERDDTDCSICYDALDYNSPSSLESCGQCRHAFHRLCIEIWAKRTPTCPLCRSHMANSNDKYMRQQQQAAENKWYLDTEPRSAGDSPSKR